MTSLVPSVVKPNLTAIQTAFTGRLYAWDMFSLYRAISGRYSTYPSILAGGLGLNIQQDWVTFIGAVGPGGRFHYVGDVYSVIYNDQIERDIRPFSTALDIQGLWEGWRRFTELLNDDAEEVGEPFLKAPGFTYALPKAEVDVSNLSAADWFLYVIYRGDIDSMEILLNLLSIYMPETIVTIPLFFKDLEGMFGLYAEWIRERFLGVPATPGARVMSKVILLADYRWYLLAGDLLSMIEPVFRTPGFSSGISRLGALIREEAEGIRVVP